jgi:hypothetical protein
MPNWKMRAKALVDGMPTTKPCRMPISGETCMMRTMRRIADAGMKLSASSVTAKSCAPPQRRQKSRILPALKPALWSRRRYVMAMRPCQVAARSSKQRCSAAARAGSLVSLRA